MVSSSTQVEVLPTVTLASGAVISIENGKVRYDISKADYQHLAQGQVALDTFEYVIQMGNGALSLATASVEIIGMNDAPTLIEPCETVIEDTAQPESVRSFEGQLLGSDVDDGAILTYGFVDSSGDANADGTVSMTSEYGTLVLDSTTGQYSFTVNAEALDALVAGEVGKAEFDVQVWDEFGAYSEAATIVYKLVGADEAKDDGDVSGVAPSEFGDVTEFVVNHGLDFVNGRRVLKGFDGNDQLKLAGVKQASDIYAVDTDGDGQVDSSALRVEFSNGGTGNGSSGNGNGNQGSGGVVEIVLSGYLDLTQDQIFSSAN